MLMMQLTDLDGNEIPILGFKMAVEASEEIVITEGEDRLIRHVLGSVDVGNLVEPGTELRLLGIPTQLENPFRHGVVDLPRIIVRKVKLKGGPVWRTYWMSQGRYFVKNPKPTSQKAS